LSLHREDDPARKAAVEGRIEDLLKQDNPYWTSVAWLIRGESAKAIRLLRRLENLPARKVLAVAYYMERQHRLFEKIMLEVAHDAPSDFGAQYYLGRFYDTEIDNCARAIPFFEGSLANNPKFPRTHYYLGFCLERSGDLPSAETHYARATELDPSYAQPWLGMARIQLAREQMEAAQFSARRASELDATDKEAWKLLAKTLRRSNPNAAAAALENAGALDQTDASIRYQLYQIYRELKQPQKAASALASYETVRSVYGQR
jgi:tetratricopeptide (TPR) repeat protein